MNSPEPLPSTRASRSEAADIWTVLLFAAAAALVVVLTTVIRLFDMFRVDGFAWTVQVDQRPIEASIDSGASGVEGYVDELLVVSTGVNQLSMIAGAASAIVWALAALTVIVAVGFLAWSFLRGRFFVPATARVFDVVGWTILAGALLVMILDKFALNGVLAAVGAEGEPSHPIEFWSFAPAWAIGIVVGLLARAFRRGIRLQEDARGLV